MEDKVNYPLVGAFVLVLGAALVAGVLWLAAGLGDREDMAPYQAFIQESVAGLNVDAPVKYLGVDVGKVSHIDIDPRNALQVRLRFLIARGTPIQRDSSAVLKTQGLTGIAYIELSGGSVTSEPLVAGPNGEVPTIPFKLSLGARLENVLTRVLADVGRVVGNLDALLDADNRAALKATLADTAALAHALAGQKAVLNAAIADTGRTARTTARASDQLAPALASITASAEAVARMAREAEGASARAGRAADAAASGVQQLGTDTLPELAGLLSEMNQLAASLRRLSEQTAANPSGLVVGRPPPQPGPGESTPHGPP